MKKQKLKRKYQIIPLRGISQSETNKSEVRNSKFKIQNLKFKQIPAFAGMTRGGAGMTEKLRE